jgi:hypothetical protein
MNRGGWDEEGVDLETIELKFVTKWLLLLLLSPQEHECPVLRFWEGGKRARAARGEW